jgi:hypothetical protein
VDELARGCRVPVLQVAAVIAARRRALPRKNGTTFLTALERPYEDWVPVRLADLTENVAKALSSTRSPRAPQEAASDNNSGYDPSASPPLLFDELRQDRFITLATFATRSCFASALSNL